MRKHDNHRNAGQGRWCATTLSVAVLLMISGACVASEGSKQQYYLERTFDGVAWVRRAAFTVSRNDESTLPRLKSVPVEVANDMRSLPSAGTLAYRVVSAETSAVLSRVVSTPCALLRTFDVASKSSLRLSERVGVLVGEGTDVVGLQLAFPPNAIHQQQGAGGASDACDFSVVSLFPEVSSELSLYLVRPVEPKLTTKYEDGPTGFLVSAPPPPPKPAAGEKGPDGKEVPQEDNRTFFEKYWLYIVMFGVWSVVNGLLAPKGGAAAAAGAAPAGAGKK